jgi:hypothetical protein
MSVSRRGSSISHEGVDGRAVSAGNDPRDDRDRDARKQQVDLGVLELGEDLVPHGHRLRAAQHVAAVRREPPGRFLVGQPVVGSTVRCNATLSAATKERSSESSGVVT